jgi:hypothetical protein
MQDTTPEPADADWPDPQLADAVNLDDLATSTTTLLIHVTQQDPELRTIEAMLELLQLLPLDTRFRALRYVQDRIEADPAAPNLKLPDMSKATPYDVARALAEADGRDLDALSTIEKGAYFRRADALGEPSFVVTRQAP